MFIEHLLCTKDYPGPGAYDSSSRPRRKRDRWHYKGRGENAHSLLSSFVLCLFFSFIDLKGYTSNLTACDVPPNPLVISVAKKFLELMLSGEWWAPPRQYHSPKAWRTGSGSWKWRYHFSARSIWIDSGVPTPPSGTGHSPERRFLEKSTAVNAFRNKPLLSQQLVGFGRFPLKETAWPKILPPSRVGYPQWRMN